jgi:DNA-binding NarL/FixJ family response regulator
VGSILERHGARILGTAEKGPEALDLIRKLTPTVALIDLNMPGLGGVDIVRALSADSCPTAAILYTGYGNSQHLAEAVKAGARGFISKDAAIEELVRAVEMVSLGDPYIEPTLASTILQWGGASTRELSTRELRILELIAAGYTSDEISSQLSLSCDTVQSHVRTIMRKLGAATRSQAVATALRETIIT